MRLQCDADDGELSVAQLASRGAGGTEDEVAEGGGVRGRDVGRDASGRWDGGGSRRPIPASSITAAPDFITTESTSIISQGDVINGLDTVLHGITNTQTTSIKFQNTDDSKDLGQISAKFDPTTVDKEHLMSFTPKIGSSAMEITCKV